MPTKILEIGYGRPSSSAVKSNGEVFRDSETHYFGMDLPRDTNRVNGDDLQTIRPVEAHWAALPYRNSAFGAVIMRSCFGQFMDNPTFWRSERWSANYALHEASRVLEPGGNLFISEENTPEDLSRLVPDILNAGFDIDAIETKVNLKTWEPNPNYLDLRQKYYGDRVRGIAGGGWSNHRYVITATKPTDRSFKIVNVHARGLLPHRDSHQSKWSGTGIDIELGYHLPSDFDTLKGELRTAKRMVELLGNQYMKYVKSLEAKQNSSR